MTFQNVIDLSARKFAKLFFTDALVDFGEIVSQNVISMEYYEFISDVSKKYEYERARISSPAGQQCSVSLLNYYNMFIRTCKIYRT